MSRYVHRFGFGEALAPTSWARAAGIVFPTDQINDSALASMSMGYQVSVTPLQMATAASAVANGGTLYEPHVVRAIVRDGQRDVVAPKVLRQAINAGDRRDGHDDHGRRRRSRHGQGRADGSLPGGRQDRHGAQGSSTGTTRRPTTTRRLSGSSRRASRRSRSSSSSTRRAPGGHYGGEVAAPIFKRIAEAALRQVGVPPTIRSDSADRRHDV